MDAIEIQRALSEVRELKKRIELLEETLDKIVEECGKWSFVPMDKIAIIATQALLGKKAETQ